MPHIEIQNIPPAYIITHFYHTNMLTLTSFHLMQYTFIRKLFILYKREQFM